MTDGTLNVSKSVVEHVQIRSSEMSESSARLTVEDHNNR